MRAGRTAQKTDGLSWSVCSANGTPGFDARRALEDKMIYEIGHVRDCNGYQYDSMEAALGAIAVQQDNRGAWLDHAQFARVAASKTGQPYRLDVFGSTGRVGTITARPSH